MYKCDWVNLCMLTPCGHPWGSPAGRLQHCICKQLWTCQLGRHREMQGQAEGHTGGGEWKRQKIKMVIINRVYQKHCSVSVYKFKRGMRVWGVYFKSLCLLKYISPFFPTFLSYILFHLMTFTVYSGVQKNNRRGQGRAMFVKITNLKNPNIFHCMLSFLFASVTHSNWRIILK